jgi:hypothetical protein
MLSMAALVAASRASVFFIDVLFLDGETRPNPARAAGAFIGRLRRRCLREAPGAAWPLDCSSTVLQTVTPFG